MNDSPEQKVKAKWPDATVKWDMRTGLYAVFASFQGVRKTRGYKKSAWFNIRSCAWADALKRIEASHE